MTETESDTISDRLKIEVFAVAGRRQCRIVAHVVAYTLPVLLLLLLLLLRCWR